MSKDKKNKKSKEKKNKQDKKGKSLLGGVTSMISKKPILFSLLGAAGVGLALRSSLGKSKKGDDNLGSSKSNGTVGKA